MPTIRAHFLAAYFVLGVYKWLLDNVNSARAGLVMILGIVSNGGGADLVSAARTKPSVTQRK